MHKKLIILGALIIALIGTYILRNNYLGSGSAGTVSSNILYLTQPITSFSGTIDKIEGNSIIISQNMILQQVFNSPIAPPNNPMQPVPPVQITPPQPKKITYKVLITDKTNIARPTVFVPYLLKQSQSLGRPMGQSEKLSIKDLKVGQIVNTSSNIDLRTLKGSQFEATYINVAAKTISISGTITNVKQNQIIVKSLPPTTAVDIGFRGGPANMAPSNQQPPKEQNYTVTIDQNTEISANIPLEDQVKQSAPKKLSMYDLKKDMQVTVYSNEDVTETTQLKALLIIPAIFTPTQIQAPIAPAASGNSPAVAPSAATQSANPTTPVATASPSVTKTP